MGEPLLSVRDLRVAYVGADGPVEVVHGVSFDLHRGGVLGLVGESGSGKSTLVQAILRTLGPPGLVTGGQAVFDGVDLLQLDEPGLRALRWTRISIVPQSALSSLNPVLTVRQHVHDTLAAHGATDRAAREARAVALMQLVSIDPVHLASYPHELSGGMRQRVVIALALALEPDLVVFDEPTTALDVVVEREILDQVTELQRQLGFAALFISHDLDLVRDFVSQVGVLLDGHLVELKPSEGLHETASHPYTRQLLGATPDVHAATRDPRLVPTVGPDPGPVLQVRGLCRDFRVGGWFSRASRRVVDEVDFDVHRGEVVALVGASGCGKTTIANLLARLLKPTAGRVLLDGHDAAGLPVLAYRKDVQLVFQDPYASLNPVHTIGHHVARPLLRHGLATPANVRARTLEVLTSVGLTPAVEFIDRHPHELSGGQRQRVAIARALAVDPDVVIADEPTSMLDVSIRMDILQLLSGLRETRRLALVLITHDLAAARHLADRILVLDGGRVVEQGTSDQLALAPTHPASKRLLDALG